MFAQLLQLIPQSTFRKIVREEHGERCAKGFTYKMQLVAMLYLQLAQAKSLSEICDGLRLTSGKLNHLGLTTAPAKSSLAYANEHRPAIIYDRLFYESLKQPSRCQPGKKRKFRFKNPLLTIDSTTIALCASLFPWAHYQHSKGAAKIHLVLDNEGYLLTYAVITEGKTPDRALSLHIWLAYFTPRGAVAREPVHISRFMGVAQRPVSCPSRGTHDAIGTRLLDSTGARQPGSRQCQGSNGGNTIENGRVIWGQTNILDAIDYEHNYGVIELMHGPINLWNNRK